MSASEFLESCSIYGKWHVETHTIQLTVQKSWRTSPSTEGRFLNPCYVKTMIHTVKMLNNAYMTLSLRKRVRYELVIIRA